MKKRGWFPEPQATIQSKWERLFFYPVGGESKGKRENYWKALGNGKKHYRGYARPWVRGVTKKPWKRGNQGRWASADAILKAS